MQKFMDAKILALICLSMFTHSDYALAFGSKSKDPQSNSTAGIQAIPIRYLELAHVTVPAFYLPNGNRVDLNTDLKSIIDSQINQSKYFRTVDATNPSHRLVITGGITSLELDILQLNLKIGWGPTGAFPVLAGGGITGEVDLRLSNLSMDFKIYDLVTKETYLASYTNETLSNLSFQVKVDISQITGSLQLLTQTKLSAAIRQAVNDIMKTFEKSSALRYVPWEAHVLSVTEGAQQLIIDAGGNAGIKTNFVFSIYSTCGSNSTVFCYERFLSDVRVSSVGVNSSTAVPFTSNDSLGVINPGDKVYVKPLKAQKN